LAATYSTLETFFFGEPPYAVAEGVRRSQEGIELDPQLVEAHATSCSNLGLEIAMAEADAEYQRAIELSPSDAGVHADYA